MSFVFIYLLLRSSLIPLVHDEAATFFHYIHKASFLPPFAHWDANNHILNSMLSYFSYSLFGSSELALRLPNLLFFPLFFFYTYKISTELSNKILRWTFIISLVFAHNFIEYFGLTRGYGMSMALLFAAIWYLIQVFKHSKLKNYFLSSLFMSFAILANLTLINSALLLFGILLIQILINYKNTDNKKSIKSFGIVLFTLGITIALSISLLFKFKEKGLLYYGTLDGLWELTVKSLIELLSGTESNIIAGFVLFYFIGMLIIFARTIIKQRSFSSLWNKNFLFFYLLIGNLIAILILGKILHINYPEDRTGLYLFPYFIGSSLFLLDSMSKQMSKKWLAITVLPFLFFPLHFLYSMNLSHTSFWQIERIPHRFHETILDKSRQSNNKLTMGGYHVRTLCWAYENFRHGGELNQMQTKNYPENISDYQIVDIKDNKKWLDNYDIIDHDLVSNLSLLERKAKIKSVLIDHAIIEDIGWQKKAFFNIYKSQIDSLENETLLVNIEFSLACKTKPFNARIVAQVVSKDKKVLSYEYIALDWKRTEWNSEENNFNASILLHELPQGSETLTIYLWNIDNQSFLAENIECSVRKLGLSSNYNSKL